MGPFSRILCSDYGGLRLSDFKAILHYNCLFFRWHRGSGTTAQEDRTQRAPGLVFANCSHTHEWFVVPCRSVGSSVHMLWVDFSTLGSPPCCCFLPPPHRLFTQCDRDWSGVLERHKHQSLINDVTDFMMEDFRTQG